MTCGIHGMAGWAHQWLHPADAADTGRVAEELADMVLGGLSQR